MAKAVNHQKPDISRLLRKRVEIPRVRMDLEIMLKNWVQEVLDRTANPPNNQGASRAMKLVAAATVNVDALLKLGPGMNLSSKLRELYLQVLWGRLADGRWFIRAVSFIPSATPKELETAQRDALRERLMDRAEADSAKRFHPRKFVFPAEDHVDTWTQDIIAGDLLLKPVIERAYEHAKAAASLMENPVTAKDMAVDLVGMGTSGASHGSNFLKKADEGYNLYDTSRTAVDAVQHKLSDESRGDKIMFITLDALSAIPGAGAFVNTLSGMFFEIAIQNGAKDVTIVRCRTYLFFIAGYIQALTMIPTADPQTNFDKRNFNVGLLVAPNEKNPYARYKVQASLLHYASSHYTAGGWGGLSYVGYPPPQWTFPDQYISNWSPDLMAAALATQLESGRYLYQ